MFIFILKTQRYVHVLLDVKYNFYYVATLWMVYSLAVRARGLEYGGREFESWSLHLRPETKLREKGGFLVVERVLRPYRWPRHCWALNPQKQTTFVFVRKSGEKAE